jgi:uncharacterized membrane protein
VTTIHPLKLIAFGFLLVLLGVVLPFLMVINVIEPTYFLVFFGYIASITGLMMGLIGSVMYVRGKREDQ